MKVEPFTIQIDIMKIADVPALKIPIQRPRSYTEAGKLAKSTSC